MILEVVIREFWSKHQHWLSYMVALGWVAAMTLANRQLRPFIGSETILLTYFFGIVLFSLILTRGAVFVSAGLAALFWNLLFVNPVHTFHIHAFEDVITFIIFFAVALIAGHITSRLRQQVKLTQVREERLAFLYRTLSNLSELYGSTAVVQGFTADVFQYFGARAVVYLRDMDRGLKSLLVAPAKALTEMEQKAARMATEENCPVGQGTGFFSDLPSLFIPMKGQSGVIGVVCFQDLPLIEETKKTLLITLVNQLAMMLERENLLVLSQQMKTNEEIDRLYNTILNLITHELQTPIAVIKGSLSALQNPVIFANPEQRQKLIHESEHAFQRLNRLIQNLLDMSRIESGKLELNRDWVDPVEVVRSAVESLIMEFPQQDIRITCEHPLLLKLDFHLMERVFYNLLRNALLYNQDDPDLKIEVSIRLKENHVVIRVHDTGRGLPPDLQRSPFTKFAKRGNLSKGLGLGLSIVRGIVEIHGASIRYTRKHGAEFTIDIPVSESNFRLFEEEK